MQTGDIINALNQRLLAFDGGAYSGKIELENTNGFTVPASGVYLKIHTKFFEPKLIGAFSEAGHYRIQGIYLIQIMVPKGTGTVVSSNLATEIVTWFNRGLVLTQGSTSVKIESSHQYSLEEGTNYLVVPVAVKFWSYMSYAQ